jgi:hypothetical protein
MEGSFAHAANHYHFKRARWRATLVPANPRLADCGRAEHYAALSRNWQRDSDSAPKNA